jgi:DNA-binding LacI/PurR family transcriptional regulator
VKRIEKNKAAELAADEMRREILAGRWDDRMPGTRALALWLGVSAPTVAAAMLRLVGEGLLEGGGQRRAFRVLAREGGLKQRPAITVTKRLLILTHLDWGELDEVSRRLLEGLRDAMAERDWKVDHQVVDFLHVKRPRRAWDQSIRVESGTTLLVLYGRKPLGEWAVRRKLRTIFLGGTADGLAVSMVAVKTSWMVEEGLTRLIAMGHQRIVIPLCDRTEAFRNHVRATTRSVMESAGQGYVAAYHNPTNDYSNPEVSRRILDSLFAIQPPTAIGFLHWKELIATQCYLAEKRLRVPEDVSLMLFGEHADAEWFHPKLARFRFPIRRIKRALISLIENDSAEPEYVSLRADYVPGPSVGPVKQGLNVLMKP